VAEWGSEAASKDYYKMEESNPEITYVEFLLMQKYSEMTDFMVNELNGAKANFDQEA